MSVWLWHVGTGREFPELGTYNNTPGYAASVAIRVRGDVQESTERPVWDAGKDPDSNYGAGPYRYSAVNRTMTVQVDLTAGEQTLGLVSKMESMTLGTDLGRLTIGARLCVTEFIRR